MSRARSSRRSSERRLKTSMLVRFSVENFLSFRDRAELSMVASGESPSPSRACHQAEYCGGHSSPEARPHLWCECIGKIEFDQGDGVGQRPCPASHRGRWSNRPHAIQARPGIAADKPTRSRVRDQNRESLFRLWFCLQAQSVLKRSGSSKSSAIRKDRYSSGPEARSSLANCRLPADDEEQFLKFTAKGTLPNRLFLTECRERNVRENVRGSSATSSTS